MTSKEEREAAAKWKRDERARMRLAGYVAKQVWVHKKDWDRVQRYLERVNKRRNKNG